MLVTEPHYRAGMNSYRIMKVILASRKHLLKSFLRCVEPAEELASDTCAVNLARSPGDGLTLAAELHLQLVFPGSNGQYYG